MQWFEVDKQWLANILARKGELASISGPVTFDATGRHASRRTHYDGPLLAPCPALASCEGVLATALALQRPAVFGHRAPHRAAAPQAAAA